MTDDARTIPPAPCLARPGWVYHPADSHVDSSRFRARQHERLLEAQPNLRELQKAAA